MTLPHMTSVYEKWAPVLGRILLGLYFFHAAFFKIPGTESFGMVVQGAQMAGLPFPTVAVFLAFILEFIGGLALLAGYHARTAAVLLSGFMVLIAIFFFRNFADPMQVGMFLNCIAVAAGLLYVSVYGAQSVAVKACQLPSEVAQAA
jgi:putative oxidoreductase